MANSPKTSKTARRSTVRTVKSRKTNIAPGLERIIPTGDGSWAYVLTDVGTTVHVRVGSEQFRSAVAAAHAAGGDIVADAVAGFADRWPDTGWELPAIEAEGDQ